LKDRKISSSIINSIDDLPEPKDREIKVDFHARLPLSIYNQLGEASRKKGMERSELIVLALKAFLK